MMSESELFFNIGVSIRLWHVDDVSVVIVMHIDFYTFNCLQLISNHIFQHHTNFFYLLDQHKTQVEQEHDTIL